MITKYCLVIDEIDQFESLRQVQTKLKPFGIDFQFVQFNPTKDITLSFQGQKITNSHDDFFDVLTSSKYLERQIDIIACDYDYGTGMPINGFDMAVKIRDIRPKKNIILYSANRKQIIEYIDTTTIQEERLLKFEKIFNLNVNLIARDAYEDTLIRMLRDEQEFNIKHEILNWLYAFERHDFKGHPKLERRTLREIAQSMESETKLGFDFQKLFVEQGISTMIELNELPPNE